MALTPDQIDEYDDYGEMFGTKGWRRLVAHLLNEIYESQATAFELGTWEEVCEAKGYAKAFAYIANYEDYLDLEKASFEQEDDES